MKGNYSLYVFTSDRDLGADQPYPNTQPDNWNTADGSVKIFYCSPGNLNWKFIKQQIRSVQPDFIYLNSMFSRFFTLYPLLQYRMGAFNSKLVLAPRGMLRPSALEFKKRKKQFFLHLFKTLGLHKNISFHATDKEELEAVERTFGVSAKGMVIPNFPANIPAYQGSLQKKKGELAMIFVGRLHPIKNLSLLLRQISLVKGRLSLTVVGNEEDQAYVEQCKAEAAALDPDKQVIFCGAVPNNKLPELLAKHHVFALPTSGENFGHAIFEALSLGKPVVISDQTPWRNLAASKAGWDLPLNGNAFAEAIQQMLDSPEEDYKEWSASAWKFAETFVASSDLRTDYAKLFS